MSEPSASRGGGRGGAREGAATDRRSEIVAFEREFPGASWLSAQVFRELELVGSLAEALIASVAQRHGLTHAALNALAVIEGHGAPMSVGEVSSSMHITSGTMTGVLDTLERNDYIERLTDPEDRRRVLVDVTPEAQAVLDRLLPEVVQATTAALSPIGDRELQALLASLARVRSAIQDVDGEMAPPARRRTPRRLKRA